MFLKVIGEKVARIGLDQGGKQVMNSIYECDSIDVREGEDVVEFGLSLSGKGYTLLVGEKYSTQAYLMNNNGRTIEQYRWYKE